MPAPRDPSLLLQAARLYYLEDRSQAEIASVLGTSRSNVSRMLTEAKRQGIVEVRVHDPAGRDRDLETALKKAFGLREVLVAQRTLSGESRLTEQVGTLVAQLMLAHLRDRTTLAMTWGHTLQAMVWATQTDHDYGCQIVQLTGGMTAVSNEISGHELIRDLAARLGSSYRFLHSPATFSTSVARDTMLAEAAVAQTLAAARSAEIAFVGIGTPSHGSSAAILAALDLSPEEQKEFWDAEPVGDIAARYYNAAGQPIHGAVEDHVLAVSLADVMAIPHVVGLAAGRAKTAGVLGALRGNILDSLICDESLATSVLSQARTRGD